MRLRLVTLAVVSSFLLFGCTNSVPDLSIEEKQFNYFKCQEKTEYLQRIDRLESLIQASNERSSAKFLLEMQIIDAYVDAYVYEKCKEFLD